MGLIHPRHRSRAALSSKSNRRPRRGERRLRLEGLEERRMLAGDPALVELNATGVPVYDKTAVVGNNLYFADSDPLLGWELKVLDTTTGTAAVLDVNPGLGDSYAGQYGGFTAVGTKLFFSAYDPSNGYELRWIDTTQATPTVNVVDVNSGVGDSIAGYYGGFVAVGTQLYFTATDAGSGAELRWIDTTEATPSVHTIEVAGGASSSNAGQHGSFAVAGTKLFFAATDSAAGDELRWIDTLEASPTVHTLDIYGGATGSQPGYYGGFMVVGSKLYFSAEDALDGVELRWLDTTAGSPSVNTISVCSGSGGAFAGQYGGWAAVGGKLYFTADDGGGNFELRWIDTTVGTPVVQSLDVNPGPIGSYAGGWGGFKALGTTLYFDAYEANTGYELRWIDTTATTPAVNTLDINPSYGSSYAGQYGFAVEGSRLFFVAQDAASGQELRWIDTSTAAPTINTLEIAAGGADSAAGQYGGFTNVGTRLYFTAHDDGGDYRLHWIDKAAATPSDASLDISNASNSSEAGTVGGFVAVGTRVYYATAHALCWTDTAAATPVLYSLPVDIDLGNTVPLTALGTKVVFRGRDVAYGNELRWIDATSDTPALNTLDIAPGSASSNPGAWYAVGTKLYFAAYDPLYGCELRWIDTALSMPWVNTLDIQPANGSSNPGIDGGYALLGTKLYFSALDTATGYELRWIDTTSDSPALHTVDVNAGGRGSSPGHLGGYAVVGSKLYFSAYDEEHGEEPRWIDTTSAAPVVNTLDVYPGSTTSLAGQYGGFEAVGTRLYFSADDPVSGCELRWIDTTSAAPAVNTLDINPGVAASNPGEYGGLTAVGTKLYFSAYTAAAGHELRWIDTAEGGGVLHTLDINSGSNGSTPGIYGDFVAVGSRLYFSAFEPVCGFEPRWIDTTSAVPTLNTIDLYSGQGSSAAGQYGGFTLDGTKIYFSATKAAHGLELFVLSVPQTPQDLVVDFSAAGLWAWVDNTTWKQIHPYNPASVVTGDLDGNGTSELIVDFGSGPGLGVWVYYNNSTWQQLHTSTTNRLLTADLNGDHRDEVIISFAGVSGLWAFDPATSNWRNLTNTPAENLVAADLDGNGKEELVGDFGAGGLQVYWNNANWQLLHSYNPRSLTAGRLDANAQADLVVDFGTGEGLWIYNNNATWTRLHTYSSALMSTGDLNGDGRDEVLVDFGSGVGLWEYYPATAAWRLLTPVRSSQLLAADLDGNGKQELVADLTDHALYIFANDTSWQYFHSYHPDRMAAGQLDPVVGGTNAVSSGAANGSASSYDRALLELLAQDGLRQTATLESLASWDSDGTIGSKKTTPRVL